MAMRTLFLLSLAALATADIFFHNPRGSNSRLSDDTEDVQNPARMFHSMNDNIHGSGARTGDTPEGGYNAPGRGRNLKYFVGSILPIEWTINAGCGTEGAAAGLENSAHCDIVLQYMCSDALRDGTSDQTIPLDADGKAQMMKTTGGIEYTYGMHENWWYAVTCQKRLRNPGLFTADRAITGRTSAYTRQNSGGAWYGYECAEEREYYPYWAPTPWRDIAIITDDTDKCEYYKAESQNVAKKGYCEGDPTEINPTSCKTWKFFDAWSASKADVLAPDCLPAPWIHDNIMSNGKDGYPMYYNWTIPDEGYASCALRVRYNVSMGDFEGFNIPAKNRVALSAADGGRTGKINSSPEGTMLAKSCCALVADGLCDCGLFIQPWAAPFNVFEDRTHRFQIIPRPATVKNLIHNLNVRGKRGNIVQTFPAVEHDFVPTVLHCKQGEWMHIQWTGSDNNRANVAGEGRDKTDRSNIVQIKDAKRNYPIESKDQTLFDMSQALNLAYVGLTKRGDGACKSFATLQLQNSNDQEQDALNCPKLNAVSPYFDGGLLPCRSPGVYHYMSTRENNLSNRSQKGSIVVNPCPAGNTNCTALDKAPLNAEGEYDPDAADQTGEAVKQAAAAAALIFVSMLF